MNATQLNQIAKENKQINNIKEMDTKPHQIDLILNLLHREAKNGIFFTHIEIIPQNRKIARGEETWGIKLENLKPTLQYLDNLGFKTKILNEDLQCLISWE